MFSKIELPYEFKALEPHIDATTMELHYTKHHESYVVKLNAAVEKQPELFEKDLIKILADLDSVNPEIQTAVRNNGGQVFNHNLFWQVMSPSGGGEPSGQIAEAINQTFGSFDDFKKQFEATAATRFGSGWAWLSVDSNKKLIVESTPNGDNPLMFGRVPILGLDVWEHAYYLKYQNKRPEYISAFWNVLNWGQVEQNLKNV
jgi:superoxide dismutase, Fe-Mn family